MEKPDVVLEFNTVKTEDGEKLTMSYRKAKDDGKSGIEFIEICSQLFGYVESEDEDE